MSKGRKKTPDAVKLLRGTNQPCRMTPAGAGLDKVAVLPRSGLKGSAKKVFELVASELIHKGILLNRDNVSPNNDPAGEPLRKT